MFCTDANAIYTSRKILLIQTFTTWCRVSEWLKIRFRVVISILTVKR